MGAGTVFLLLLVIILAIIAFAAFTGLWGKLKRDQTQGDLPSQSGGGRPQHVEVSTDPDDTPTAKPAPGA
jgi:hypothetical protein